MLTQLTSRLASQLNDLTIQVVKEDWTLTSSPSSLAPSPSGSLFTPPPNHPAVLPNPHNPPPSAPAVLDTTTTAAAKTFDPPLVQGVQLPRPPVDTQTLGRAQEAPLPSLSSQGHGGGASEDLRYVHPHYHAATQQNAAIPQGQEGQFVGGGGGSGGSVGLNLEHKHHSTSRAHGSVASSNTQVI